MPWTAEPPGHGFTSGPTPWLPFDARAATRNAESQSDADDSTLAYYRDLLARRRAMAPAVADASVSLLEDLPDGVVGYRRGPLLVLLNCHPDQVEVSHPAIAGGVAAIPGETTIWMDLS